MAMLTNSASFARSLSSLWDNPVEAITYKDTCDLFEGHWSFARVTGHELPLGPNFAPGITYPLMAPLGISETGTSAGAAAAIEAALSVMCLASVFVLTPPAVASGVPLPTPGGKATPGLLTTALTIIFTNGALADSSTARLVANEIIAYLAGWTLNVTIGPTTTPQVII